jgi:hypothetical protein
MVSRKCINRNFAQGQLFFSSMLFISYFLTTFENMQYSPTILEAMTSSWEHDVVFLAPNLFLAFYTTLRSLHCIFSFLVGQVYPVLCRVAQGVVALTLELCSLKGVFRIFHSQLQPICLTS